MTPVSLRSATALLSISLLAAACGSEVNAPPADVPAVDAAPVDASDAAVTDADAGPTYHPWTPDASSPQTPIEAPSETWTFIPFPDSACGNGSPAGIGVNLTTRSRRVLIYLQGGGGCWDALTCFLPTASNINDNYTASTFRGEIGGMGRALMFSRTDARNPFRDASFVYVPYCTGDIHGGDNVITYTLGEEDRTIHHVGARNIDAYLRRLALTFPMADRVWLTGASAGGYGAGLHWDRVQRAFPMARVDLLDDSGPPINPPEVRYGQMMASWNIQFPEGCTGCRENLGALFDFYATRFPPPHRMGMLSYTQDRTISTYFGITGPQFQTLLDGLTRTSFDPRPNFRYFELTGNDHTMIGNLATVTSPGGTTLLQWVTAWATDASPWENVHP